MSPAISCSRCLDKPEPPPTEVSLMLQSVNMVLVNIKPALVEPQDLFYLGR